MLVINAATLDLNLVFLQHVYTFLVEDSCPIVEQPQTNETIASSNRELEDIHTITPGLNACLYKCKRLINTVTTILSTVHYNWNFQDPCMHSAKETKYV